MHFWRQYWRQELSFTKEGARVGWLGAVINTKKKRRLAEANRHLPVNSKSLIELPTAGVHDRQQ
jgi:hypothetical protein